MVCNELLSHLTYTVVVGTEWKPLIMGCNGWLLACLYTNLSHHYVSKEESRSRALLLQLLRLRMDSGSIWLE